MTYPFVIIPDVVIDRLHRYFVDVDEILHKSSPMLGDKSPLFFVTNGYGTWEQVLWEFDKLFSYSATQ